MWLRKLSAVLAVVVCACASSPPVPPFDPDALFANPRTYAAQRYQAGDLAVAIIADLRAAGFECGRRGTVDECVRSQAAFGSCFDVWTVRIDPAAPLSAEQARRCLGALPPQE